MKPFSQILTENNILLEKLITFGGKAYPKYGNVVIMAGGAGSGKGFTLGYLIGIEGHVFDPDAMKILAMKSTEFAKRIKDETGYDIKSFDLKNPENVSKIHEILSDQYGITKAKERTVLASALMAPTDRKPNLIFDTTLSGMDKLESISRRCQEMGYDKKNIHLVWVVNDFRVAIEQNKGRSRVVPEEILLGTHEGASLTMRKLLDNSSTVAKYLDGDIWLSFNKKGVDSKLVRGPNTVSHNPYSGKERNSGYLEDSNYMKIKAQGKRTKKLNDLDREIISKIQEYVPDTLTWK